MNLIHRISNWLRPIPHAAVGKKYLAKKVGSTRMEVIFGRVKICYRLFLDQRRLPSNLILRWHEKHYLLPGLALYQVLLDEYSGDVPAAMSDVEEVVRLTILDQTRPIFAPLKWPCDPFPLFRFGFRLIMNLFPQPGWIFDYLENSSQRVAFNATQCYYFKVLSQLGYPEITRVYCRADDAMAENFPSTIRYQRTTTIGKGEDLCDFCYYRNVN
jgi:hypothetical protein